MLPPPSPSKFQQVRPRQAAGTAVLRFQRDAGRAPGPQQKRAPNTGSWGASRNVHACADAVQSRAGAARARRWTALPGACLRPSRSDPSSIIGGPGTTAAGGSRVPLPPLAHETPQRKKEPKAIDDPSNDEGAYPAVDRPHAQAAAATVGFSAGRWLAGSLASLGWGARLCGSMHAGMHGHRRAGARQARAGKGPDCRSRRARASVRVACMRRPGEGAGSMRSWYVSSLVGRGPPRAAAAPGPHPGVV